MGEELTPKQLQFIRKDIIDFLNNREKLHKAVIINWKNNIEDQANKLLDLIKSKGANQSKALLFIGSINAEEEAYMRSELELIEQRSRKLGSKTEEFLNDIL